MNKPYYRIYRPFNKNIDNPASFDYITDKRSCSNRKELVRYFKVLEKEVSEILEHIELNKANKATYSLKIYKLFLSICVEVENNFKGILYANNYKINEKLYITDYFKLENALKLSDYKAKITTIDSNMEFQPFREWKTADLQKPYLSWYTAYNEVKHNRSENIKSANLENLLNAFTALYILLYSQFYEYSNTVMIENIPMLIIDGEDSFISIGEKMVEIIKKPNWKSNEKYNFNWDEIVGETNPYQCFKFN